LAVGARAGEVQRIELVKAVVVDGRIYARFTDDLLLRCSVAEQGVQATGLRQPMAAPAVACWDVSRSTIWASFAHDRGRTPVSVQVALLDHAALPWSSVARDVSIRLFNVAWADRRQPDAGMSLPTSPIGTVPPAKQIVGDYFAFDERTLMTAVWADGRIWLRVTKGVEPMHLWRHKTELPPHPFVGIWDGSAAQLFFANGTVVRVTQAGVDGAAPDDPLGDLGAEPSVGRVLLLIDKDARDGPTCWRFAIDGKVPRVLRISGLPFNPDDARALSLSATLARMMKALPEAVALPRIGPSEQDLRRYLEQRVSNAALVDLMVEREKARGNVSTEEQPDE